MVINNHGKARLLKFYEKLVRFSAICNFAPVRVYLHTFSIRVFLV